MWPDRLSNSGPLALELDALPFALRGRPAHANLRPLIIKFNNRPYAFHKISQRPETNLKLVRKLGTLKTEYQVEIVSHTCLI